MAVGGRFDEQRFGYVRYRRPRWRNRSTPTARADLSARYFPWAGPASLKHLRWFAGCTRQGRVLGDLADSPCQLVVDRGRLVGLWEYDPGAERVVHRLFVPADDTLRAAVALIKVRPRPAR